MAYGLWARVRDVLVSPNVLFHRQGERGRWLDVLCLVALVNATSAGLLWRSDTAKAITADLLERDRISLQRTLTEEQFRRWEEAAPSGVRHASDFALSAGLSAVLGPVFLALLFQIVLNVVLLRQVAYTQVLTVFSYCSVIWSVEQQFVNALTYLSGSLVTSATVVQLLPAIRWPEGFVSEALERLNVFAIWWIPVASVGLARFYGLRRWWPLALTLGTFLTAWVIGRAILAGLSVGIGHPRL